MNVKTQRIAVCGVLTALAMIFSYIESVISIPVGIPGVKLGIANIAVIAVLYVVGNKEGVIVNLIRIILTGIMFGNIYSFLFSFTGGMLSVLLMIAAKKSKLFSMTGVSIIGGVSHNIGQIAAAVIIMETPAIIYYLPALIAAGVITGIVIGVVAQMITKRVNHAVGKLVEEEI